MIQATTDLIIEAKNVSVYYADKPAVRDINLDIERNRITALIGPSGCGKTTLLRCFNRMNDLVPIARTEGQILFEGQDLYSPFVDPTEIRYKIGMVFQRPNPFPKSIYDNIAFGPRINGFRGNMDELVERSLRGAALWDEVKDRLRASGLSLSGGQQQRLCIARTLAVEPTVILMDEPCSALDPIATLAIEDLMRELSGSTPSSSSPTTCSRRPACPTTPPSSPPTSGASESWWSTGRPGRFSPIPGMSAPRRTSPEDSDKPSQG